MLYDSKEQANDLTTYAQDPRARVGFGFPSIDERVLRNGGMAPGDVAMLIGRSEVGKTQFLTNVLHNMVMQGVSVLDVSLEMSTPQKVMRMACVAYELDSRTLETGLKDGWPKAFDWLDQYEEDFKHYGVYKPTDTEGAGFDDIDIALGEFEARTGSPARVVALDFLGLMKREQYSGQEVVRIPRLAAEAERWADAREVSLILLHQTGRQNEVDPTKRNHGATPLDMTDAMYGGEANMDYVFGLYRPAKAPPPQDVDSEEYQEWEAMVFELRNRMFLQVLKSRHSARTPEMQYPGYALESSWPSGRLVELNPTTNVTQLVPRLQQGAAAYSVPAKDAE